MSDTGQEEESDPGEKEDEDDLYEAGAEGTEQENELEKHGETDPKNLLERDTSKPVAESRARETEPEAEDIEVEIEETPKSKVREAVVEEVDEYFSSEGLPEIFPRDAEPVSGEGFFSFDYLDEYEEVERYWAKKPYSYISVLFDPEEEEFLYHINEPHIDEFQEYVRSDVNTVLRDILIHEDPVDDEERREVLDERMEEVFEQYVGEIDPEIFYKTRYYLLRDFDGYGKVDAMMRDRGIEDISCDGPGIPVFVYHREYRDLETNVVYTEEELNPFVLRLAQQSDKHISVANPMVDASLPDGSRIQMTLGREVSSRGSNFTIRRFRDVPFTPVDLIRWGTFSAEQMAYIWLAIQNNMSLIFAGGTASGKTTSMNAISLFIPRKSKVISIEDTREITLPHQNWIQGITRESPTGEEKSDVGMYQLLEAALRQRPEYLLVGEVRTEPKVAQTFFQAMATGHTSYTTFHADSVETVLSRMGNEPLNVPAQMLRELDIVAVQKQVFRDGRRVRRNMMISELGVEEGEEREHDEVDRRDIYRWESRPDEFEKVSESAKLQEIMDIRGWDEEELRDEMEKRERLLKLLVEEDIFEYEKVVNILRRFEKNPDVVLQEAEDGRLG